MKTSVVYVIRHGEAECNLNTQDNDENGLSCLTNKGYTQSLMAGEWFKKNNIHLDLLYSSEMKRSIQTATLLNTSSPIIIDNKINERNIGEVERIIENNIPMSLNKQFKLTKENYLQWRAKNGESQLDVINRVESFVKNNKLNNSLIVSHGYVIFAIRSIFLGLTKPYDYYNFISQPNNFVRHCQIYKFIFEEGNPFAKEESYYVLDNNWIKI